MGLRVFAALFFVSLLSSICGFFCETLGGLAFLAAGLRLWRYHLLPLLWEITGPVIWLIVFLVMGPFMLAFDAVERDRGWEGRRRTTFRVLYLVVVGPVVEVLIDELVCKARLGGPLYTHTVLPTLEGPGSLLSPFDCLTLYDHYPLTEATHARLDAWLLQSESRRAVAR